MGEIKRGQVGGDRVHRNIISVCHGKNCVQWPCSDHETGVVTG